MICMLNAALLMPGLFNRNTMISLQKGFLFYHDFAGDLVMIVFLMYHFSVSYQSSGTQTLLMHTSVP